MLDNVTQTLHNIMITVGVFAPFLACFFIIVESVFPVIPLCVFITINSICFGSVIGFLMSYTFTVLGCFLSYYIFKKGFRRVNEKTYNNKKFAKCMNYVKNLSLPLFTVVLSIPFTPAFLMNIAAGISKMDFKKFAKAVIIGKLFMVYFWNFIGTGIVESFKSPVIILKVVIMLVMAYVVSKIISIKVDYNSSK